jgi:alpha-tubulin suppressor-like RCC1 family protein
MCAAAHCSSDLQKEGNIHFLDCGPEYSMAIVQGGHVYTWGHGENGKLGHQDNNDKKIPQKAAPLAFPPVRVAGLTVGAWFTGVCTP